MLGLSEELCSFHDTDQTLGLAVDVRVFNASLTDGRCIDERCDLLQSCIEHMYRQSKIKQKVTIIWSSRMW